MEPCVARRWRCVVVLCGLAAAHGAPLSAVSGLGVVSTIAGTGAGGYSGDGNVATATTLRGPGSLAFDAHGNLYFNDITRVRRIDAATKVVDTLAGLDDIFPFSDGDGKPATQAHVTPSGIAVSSLGDVFLVDVGNEATALRRIDHTTGIITTVAGDLGYRGCDAVGDGGPAVAAHLCRARGLAIDRSDNLYIADGGNGRIRRIDAATGIISTVAGRGRTSDTDGDGGLAVAAGLGFVTEVSVDGAGNVYLASSVFSTDVALGGVRRVAAGSGIISTVAPMRGAGLLKLVASGDGTVYVAEQVRSVISRVLPNGSIDAVAAGGVGFAGDGGPAVNARFMNINGLAADAQGNLVIADALNHRIRKIAGGLEHDVPLAGDLDGDGKSDLVVWRPSTGAWYWLSSSSFFSYAAAQAVQWGDAASGDVPLLADIDGDRKADLIVWRRQTGTWYWLTSGTGYRPELAGSVQFGNPDYGDRPLVGDIDGDGRADLAIWRATTGTFYWLTSSSGYAAADMRQWGDFSLGDLPFLGDVDGDGRADLIVFRPPATTWFWLPSSRGYAYSAAGSLPTGRPTSVTEVQFVADVDGDGRVDFGHWSDGAWIWARSTRHYALELLFQWGSRANDDVPMPMDVDGDRRADGVVWRRGTGTWYWLTSLDGYSRFAGQQQWGR